MYALWSIFWGTKLLNPTFFRNSPSSLNLSKYWSRSPQILWFDLQIKQQLNDQSHQSQLTEGVNSTFLQYHLGVFLLYSGFFRVLSVHKNRMQNSLWEECFLDNTELYSKKEVKTTCFECNCIFHKFWEFFYWILRLILTQMAGHWENENFLSRFMGYSFWLLPEYPTEKREGKVKYFWLA